MSSFWFFFFFFQAEDGIRDGRVTGVQTCALPIYSHNRQRETVDLSAARQGVFGNAMPCRRRRRWPVAARIVADRKSTRLNSSHPSISYAVFCLKKKKKKE